MHSILCALSFVRWKDAAALRKTLLPELLLNKKRCWALLWLCTVEECNAKGCGESSSRSFRLAITLWDPWVYINLNVSY